MMDDEFESLYEEHLRAEKTRRKINVYLFGVIFLLNAMFLAFSYHETDFWKNILSYYWQGINVGLMISMLITLWRERGLT